MNTSGDTRNETVLVVLGGSNGPDGQLSQMSLDRCEQAVRTFWKHPDSRILTTGGWGQHFNTATKAHGDLMKGALVRRGLPAEPFYPNAISGYTEQDAQSAAATLGQPAPRRILLLTSDFHIERAVYYFRIAFPASEIIPCPAPSTLAPAELARREAHERTRLAALPKATHPWDKVAKRAE